MPFLKAALSLCRKKSAAVCPADGQRKKKAYPLRYKAMGDCPTQYSNVQDTIYERKRDKTPLTLAFEEDVAVYTP